MLGRHTPARRGVRGNSTTAQPREHAQSALPPQNTTALTPYTSLIFLPQQARRVFVKRGTSRTEWIALLFSEGWSGGGLHLTGARVGGTV
jgi:hypothetical protein